MKHKVVYRFKDLETDHIYNVGDLFPHDGSKVKKSRIEELSTEQNKLKKVLIVKFIESDSTKNETETIETVVEDVVEEKVDVVAVEAEVIETKPEEKSEE